VAGIVFRRLSRGFLEIWEFIELRGGGTEGWLGQHPPGHARPLWRGLVGVAHLGLCLQYFFLSPVVFWPKKNPQKVSLHLDSVWYGFSVNQKQGRKQQLALGTMSIGQYQKMI
jgi:hypothetical protein